MSTRKHGKIRRARRSAALLLGAVALVAATASADVVAATSGAPTHKPSDDGGGKDGKDKRSKSDKAKAKLHPRLQEQVEAGSTESIYVFATVTGDPTAAAALLDNSHTAEAAGAALVVGAIHVQSLVKLASAAGVVAVSPIDFAQTGSPLGDPDDEVGKHPNGKMDHVLKEFLKKEVPYSKAPPLRGSNFEALSALALLDANTHDFAEAWNNGYTGTGVTVGVLDGGTDFGHPDLLNTWQVWSGLTGARAAWNGWPKAFDPYGTLQVLAAPDLIEQGLSWYTLTAPATCKDWAKKKAKADCKVKFAARTGPSRNFAAPSGTVQHDYRFPAGVSKSGNVRLGNHPDDHLLALYGERPAFLVTDSTMAGVYDTVYVDLDHDFRFDDEKPVTKSSPASYRDVNGDGYTDLSGGLLYFISDGAAILPGGADAFGVGVVEGPGVLLVWTGDFDPAIGGHGTATASNVVGQGVINGRAPTFSDVPGGTYPGAVIGGAPHAKLAPYGDIYFSFEFSTQFGYFLATHPTRGIDVTSNSYGSSNVDNDVWDAASQEADVIHDGSRTTSVYSTGNGAPGFGTTAPPSPTTGLSIGASTQFGGTGWDSIDRASQIVDDDVMVWSNRGPGANGGPGVDVVADGAYSAGDVTLNTVLDGRQAWDTWGGTSRSAPVAAAATALVYQSYRQAHGGVIPPGFYDTATEILKSSAEDLGYDSTIQGAGSVDAAAATAAAAGARARVLPDEWRAGDYRSTEYPAFAHVMEPGTSDTQSFAIDGGGPWTVSDRQMVQTGTSSMEFSSAQLAQESVYNFNAPDYLIDLTDEVNAHQDADLMVVRVQYPRAQFDGDGTYVEDQGWRLLTYNWTDINGDGNLWTDASGDGVVDHKDRKTISNPDASFDLDWKNSEIDKGEYVRFMYHRAAANALTNFVRNPMERMADGLFLGLQHSQRNPAIPVTDFQIQIDWYENADWGWVTTTPTSSGFDASITVPAETPFGMYSGAIVLTNADDTMVVPVSVAVSATATQDSDGTLQGAIEFGGEDVAAAQADLVYNNGSVFGGNDWGWRAESGDWRFFFLDVPAQPAAGTLFLARTTWNDPGPATDIDTLIMGKSENHFQVLLDEVFGGPYVIDTVGNSPNTNIGAGVWTFDTATGAAEDFVAAPVQEGLHSVVLHQVGWDGDQFDTPFSVTLGSAAVAPSSVVIDSATDAGSFDVTVTSSIDLAGLAAEGFGLSQPVVLEKIASQDDPNDPSSASVQENVTIDHASRLTVETDLATDDIDLFVVYDANNDGLFTNDEIVASSATGSGEEFVELIRPDDGNYQVWVQGWAVVENPPFNLAIDAVQGHDLTVSGLPTGPVAAETPVTVTVNFNKPMTADQTYFGELQLGPPSAPSAFTVPIVITRTGSPPAG